MVLDPPLQDLGAAKQLFVNLKMKKWRHVHGGEFIETNG